jgi:hypothetical protein
MSSTTTHTTLTEHCISAYLRATLRRVPARLSCRYDQTW